MDIYFNFKKILDNYDDLTPILMEYFAEKSKKSKWDKGDR